jgi:hypothetical protein
MTVNMVTLAEPQSGTKRPKLTTPKNDAFAIACEQALKLN